MVSKGDPSDRLYKKGKFKKLKPGYVTMIYFTNTIISWTTVLILVGYGDRTPQVKALLTYCTGTVSPYWETTW